MRTPTYARIFRSLCAVAAYLNAKLITLPTIHATPTSTLAIQAKNASGRDDHLELVARGDTKIRIKHRTQAVRKKPNMMLDVIRSTSRMVTTCVGSAMVAPDKSSDMMISTG